MAFRPPRVVFVLGLVSLINSLTSGKTLALQGCAVSFPFPPPCELSFCGSARRLVRRHRRRLQRGRDYLEYGLLRL